jgi:hypothetical protein
MPDLSFEKAPIYMPIWRKTWRNLNDFYQAVWLGYAEGKDYTSFQYSHSLLFKCLAYGAGIDPKVSRSSRDVGKCF